VNYLFEITVEKKLSASEAAEVISTCLLQRGVRVLGFLDFYNLSDEQQERSIGIDVFNAEGRFQTYINATSGMRLEYDEFADFAYALSTLLKCSVCIGDYCGLEPEACTGRLFLFKLDRSVVDAYGDDSNGEEYGLSEGEEVVEDWLEFRRRGGSLIS